MLKQALLVLLMFTLASPLAAGSAGIGSADANALVDGFRGIDAHGLQFGPGIDAHGLQFGPGIDAHGFRFGPGIDAHGLKFEPGIDTKSGC